jgi:hypothetical protein
MATPWIERHVALRWRLPLHRTRDFESQINESSIKSRLTIHRRVGIVSCCVKQASKSSQRIYTACNTYLIWGRRPRIDNKRELSELAAAQINDKSAVCTSSGLGLAYKRQYKQLKAGRKQRRYPHTQLRTNTSCCL